MWISFILPYLLSLSTSPHCRWARDWMDCIKMPRGKIKRTRGNNIANYWCCQACCYLFLYTLPYFVCLLQLFFYIYATLHLRLYSMHFSVSKIYDDTVVQSVVYDSMISSKRITIVILLLYYNTTLVKIWMFLWLSQVKFQRVRVEVVIHTIYQGLQHSLKERE